MNNYTKELLEHEYINIYDLADILEINIATPISEYDNLGFISMSHIKKDNKFIMLNTNIIRDNNMANFILCYQIAEYLNNENKEYISNFEIDNLDKENYELAKIISKKVNINKKLIKTK